MPDSATIWTVIVALGVVTYLIRFSFIGLMSGRETPPWALRLLRYVPVSILPALVAPAILWPPATGGEPDLARGLAALVTLAAGAWSRSAPLAFIAGLIALLLLLRFI
ncbi:AzlD domain-containing protein [Pikeienuella sp. HZG-20]|uniref:AzlD domain-containing protein n=1 Tax=Paludibacillus litoralis TaxID=3133267 RepID=UPI0030ED9597